MSFKSGGSRGKFALASGFTTSPSIATIAETWYSELSASTRAECDASACEDGDASENPGDPNGILCDLEVGDDCWEPSP